MMYNLKLLLTALSVVVIGLSDVVSSAHLDIRPTNEIQRRLTLIRDRTRERYSDYNGNAQLASILVTDSNGDEVGYDSAPFIRDYNIHAEEYLLHFSGTCNVMPPSGTVYIFSHFSPCVQGCLTMISSFAERYPNLIVYVGFQRFYGDGNHVMTNELREIMFTNSLTDLPPNLRYMYIPRVGQASWITFHEGRTPVE